MELFTIYGYDQLDDYYLIIIMILLHLDFFFSWLVSPANRHDNFKIKLS